LVPYLDTFERIITRALLVYLVRRNRPEKGEGDPGPENSG
jgi:hypothetical protein